MQLQNGFDLNVHWQAYLLLLSRPIVCERNQQIGLVLVPVGSTGKVKEIFFLRLTFFQHFLTHQINRIEANKARRKQFLLAFVCIMYLNILCFF